MAHDSWTHRLARVAIRPLLGTGITPNPLTTARLLSGLTACAAFAVGGRSFDIWAGVLWVLSAFLDRADGELARVGRMTSASGHAYDYVCDVTVNGLVFLAIGIGLRESTVGAWAIALGVIAGVSVAIASLFSEALERRQGGGQKAFEGRGGFDFDDVLYLFGPVAWAGLLLPLLLGATVGGPVFALWTFIRLRRLSALATSESTG